MQHPPKSLSALIFVEVLDLFKGVVWGNILVLPMCWYNLRLWVVKKNHFYWTYCNFDSQECP